MASAPLPPHKLEHGDLPADGPPLKFETLASFGKARVGRLTLPHGVVHTPVFMPVGTQGTIKSLTPEQVEACGPQIILGNTYHLGLRPGADTVAHMGGLHKFMGWPRNLLTDSGGFQMVSLLHLAEITEEGVHFQSPVDGSTMLLTPEKSIELQNQIGADIMMALDDVVHSCTTGPRVEEACHRTLRWIDRCIKAHKRPKEQNLFGIVQGGLNKDLRAYCLREMVKRDLPGYAIGGLSGGEEKSLFWRVVDQCTSGLPDSKPRYCMGVGYVLDLAVCVALGTDMFDCVFPTRCARFGSALTLEHGAGGSLQLRRTQYADDMRPIDETCDCPVCTKPYSRAFLHTVAGRETVGSSLISQHNIRFMIRFMDSMRASISENRFPAFIEDLCERLHPEGAPKWAAEAFASAGITVKAAPEKMEVDEAAQA